MYYQQGDVLLEVVPTVEGEKISHNGVLAEGEVTGHTHRIADLTGLAFYEKDGVLFLQAPKSFSVVHEEHKVIDVPMGTYRVRKVLEYDHFLEESRSVRD